MDAIRLHVTEPDQAREICGRVYYPHRLTVLHDPARFAMSLSALNLGPVAVGLLGYAGEVCLETAELETGYEVNVPLSGRLLTSSGPAEVYATPYTAALYRPDARTRLQMLGPTAASCSASRSRVRPWRRAWLTWRRSASRQMAYLRQVRLQRADADLRAAADAAVGAGRGVAAIASRWGFTNFGRFAAAYRARYGRTPSEALRGAR